MATSPKKSDSAIATKTIAPTTDDARIVINDRGYVIFTTPAFGVLSGLTEDSLRGAVITDVLHFVSPDDAFHSQGLFGMGASSTEPDCAQLARSLREGPHMIQFGENAEELHFDRVTMPGGNSFIVASQSAAVRADGKDSKSTALDPGFIDLIARIQQKSEEKKTPARPARIDDATSDSETHHFMGMSHDLLVISDMGGRLRKVNSVFASALLYTDSDMETLAFLDIIHPDDKPQVRNTLAALMYDDSGQEDIVDCEARIVAHDGSVYWMEWRHKRSGDSIYSVGRDVTAFKSNEVALKQQEMMLREAQSIGHMGHWRWIVGSNDIQWSDEIYKIFGVQRSSFVPALDAVNRMTHKRDVGRLLQAFQRAIIEQNDYDMEFRITRPDGEIRHIRCEGRCEHDANRDVVALFGIMQDVTERALYEQNLTEAKDSAERAYAAKSQFLANMSHELRTPLNAIIGFSEMMQRQLLGPIGSPRYLDYIGGIRESGEHLLDLISDILDMSKIEAGKYELDLEELHVAKVIRLAVHMMEGRATEAKVAVAIEISNENLQVIADRRALMQILLNLLSNAVKFTESGGSVRIECIERGDYVSVKIHDTGIGIPANQLKNITRPFEQAASHYTRKHEGTGLGLAITKELIELHGGSLHIDSTVGVGTTVTVRLPYNAHDAIKNRENLVH